MADNKQNIPSRWGSRAIQFALSILVLAMAVDYGKHLVLKSILQNQITLSEGTVAVDSIAVSPWPLLDNKLVLKNIRVTFSGEVIDVETITIRQSWTDWKLAHIQARDVRSSDMVVVEKAQGILDTAHIKSQVKISDVMLKDIKVKLPLLSFSGPIALFDFIYDMSTHHLTLKTDVPQMVFPSGATFGLKGEGAIETKDPIHGNMDVKIKNIDKMMKELVDVGVINASQAGLVVSGSKFLSNIGLHDITLPLIIKDNIVSLGPIALFTIKKHSKIS